MVNTLLRETTETIEKISNKIDYLLDIQKKYKKLMKNIQNLIKEIELTDLENVVYADGTQKRMTEKERKEILYGMIKKHLL